MSPCINWSLGSFGDKRDEGLPPIRAGLYPMAPQVPSDQYLPVKTKNSPFKTNQIAIAVGTGLLGILAGCASYGSHEYVSEPLYPGDRVAMPLVHTFDGNQPGQFDPDARSIGK